MVFDDNYAYVGGRFSFIGGQNRAGLAKLSFMESNKADPDWNPDPKSFTPSGLPLVSALVIRGSDLFVGGKFDRIGNEERINLAKLGVDGMGRADPDWNPITIRKREGHLNFVSRMVGSQTDLYLGVGFKGIGVQVAHLENISRSYILSHISPYESLPGNHPILGRRPVWFARDPFRVVPWFTGNPSPLAFFVSIGSSKPNRKTA